MLEKTLCTKKNDYRHSIKAFCIVTWQSVVYIHIHSTCIEHSLFSLSAKIFSENSLNAALQIFSMLFHRFLQSVEFNS